MEELGTSEGGNGENSVFINEVLKDKQHKN